MMSPLWSRDLFIDAASKLPLEPSEWPEPAFVRPTAFTKISVSPGPHPDAAKSDIKEDLSVLNALRQYLDAKIRDQAVCRLTAFSPHEASRDGISYPEAETANLAQKPRQARQLAETSEACGDCEPRRAPCGCKLEAMPCHYFWKRGHCSKGEDCIMCHHVQGPKKSRPSKIKRMREKEEKMKKEKERSTTCTPP